MLFRSYLDILRKQAETIGTKLELRLKGFDEDLAHNLSIGTFEVYDREEKKITAIRRFFSKYQDIIDSISIKDKDNILMFTRVKNNYFKVDKKEKNTDELYLYDIKRIKKIGRYKLSYRVGITEQNGEIKRELEVSVNLYRMMNTEATISYPGQGAFYWMIDLDGGTRIIVRVS